MDRGEMLHADEVYQIQGAIYEVYRILGNGYAEEVYQQCLEREFALRSIPFESKKALTIYYKGEPIEKTYIPDLYCFGKIIVELKSCRELTEEHFSQLVNYLTITKSRLGLLVNFGSYPKVTIKRWAN